MNYYEICPKCGEDTKIISRSEYVTTEFWGTVRLDRLDLNETECCGASIDVDEELYKASLLDDRI